MSGALTGLINTPGTNSCYINSIIQVLRHTTNLNKILDHKQVFSTDRTLIVEEWNNLRKLMWSKKCLVNPKRWNHIVRSNQEMENLTNNTIQQDGTEYLIKLLDTFHESLKRKVNMNIEGEILNENDELASECYKEFVNLYKDNYSEIIKLFYGIQLTTIVSNQDEKVLSKKVEPFSIVNVFVPLRKTVSLYDCFDETCKTEILDGDQAWFNEKTSRKEPVKIKKKFFTLPEVLIISIQNYVKKQVDFPVDRLVLTDYMLTNSNDCIYTLYAVCNHIGNENCGHYYSYIKVDESWYEFNDTTVKKIRNIVTPNAYCLFYKKI